MGINSKEAYNIKTHQCGGGYRWRPVCCYVGVSRGAVSEDGRSGEVAKVATYVVDDVTQAGSDSEVASQYVRSSIYRPQ